MLRIGSAASKMAKGKLSSYNFFVVLLSFVFSLFIFLICGFVVLLVIFLLFAGISIINLGDFHALGLHISQISLGFLAVVIGIFNVVAIVKNLHWKQDKI